MDTAPRRKFKAGLIGACAGIMRGSYIPAITRNPSIEISAAMDLAPQPLAELSRTLGCEEFASVDALLRRDDIEVVFITTPDNCHCEHTIKAAEAGKHISCTKPLAMTMKEARKMRDAVKRNGVIFMCGMNMRYSGWARTVKNALRSGDIGTPVFVRWIMKGSFYSYPPGHFYRKRESGGQILHNGAHYLDTMSHWIDSLPNEIYGVSTRNYAPGDTMDFDNYQNVSMRFDNGSVGHLEHNQMLVNPRGYPTAIAIMIVGTNGMLDVSVDDRRAVELYSGGKLLFPAPSYNLLDNSGFNMMIEDFINAVAHHGPSPIPIEHSMRILDACLKVNSSCIDGKVHSTMRDLSVIKSDATPSGARRTVAGRKITGCRPKF